MNVAFHHGRRRIDVLDATYAIDDLHSDMFDDFGTLETSHTYIQWIFPIETPSHFNNQSTPLSPAEAHSIASSLGASLRVFYSFLMMLRFYGFSITQRGIFPAPRLSAARFAHLCASRHNWLRITRILRSLTLLGLKAFAGRWLLALKTEIDEGRLCHPELRASLVQHWIPALSTTSVWPTTNAVTRLWASKPSHATKQLCDLLRQDCSVAGLYALRRYVRGSFSSSSTSQSLLVLGLLSPKRIFCQAPRRAILLTIHMTTMRRRCISMHKVRRMYTSDGRVDRLLVRDREEATFGLDAYALVRHSIAYAGDAAFSVFVDV